MVLVCNMIYEPYFLKTSIIVEDKYLRNLIDYQESQKAHLRQFEEYKKLPLSSNWIKEIYVTDVNLIDYDQDKIDLKLKKLSAKLRKQKEENSYKELKEIDI